MKKKKKPIEVYDEREPMNVCCSHCNCWLARVNAVKIKGKYICISCDRK